LKRKGREGRLCKQFSRNLNFVPKLFYKYIGLLVLIPIRKGEEGLLQNHTSEIKIEFTKKIDLYKNMQGYRCIKMHTSR
jgi:hypothetical protein